jgi:hypothetical protein
MEILRVVPPITSSGEIQVSEGEKVVFGLNEFRDESKKTNFNHEDYAIEWIVSGDGKHAEWRTKGSGSAKTTDHLPSNNVGLFIADNWDGTTITITVTVINTSDIAQPSIAKTWKLIPRKGPAPEQIQLFPYPVFDVVVTTHDDWATFYLPGTKASDNKAIYAYEFLPTNDWNKANITSMDDRLKKWKTNYQDHHVTETLEQPVAQFELKDLKPAWLKTHQIETAQDAANLLFEVGGSFGSFAIGKSHPDGILDQHYGIFWSEKVKNNPAIADAFTAEAWNNGIVYSITQHFYAANQNIGTCVIDVRLKLDGTTPYVAGFRKSKPKVI